MRLTVEPENQNIRDAKHSRIASNLTSWGYESPFERSDVSDLPQTLSDHGFSHESQVEARPSWIQWHKRAFGQRELNSEQVNSWRRRSRQVLGVAFCRVCRRARRVVALCGGLGELQADESLGRRVRRNVDRRSMHAVSEVLSAKAIVR
jgi:hypothetical protein